MENIDAFIFLSLCIITLNLLHILVEYILYASSYIFLRVSSWVSNSMGVSNVKNNNCLNINEQKKVLCYINAYLSDNVIPI